MGDLLGPEFPADIGVAVSGGGDSMAMLHLAADWARVYGTRLWPVTVDHGLRPESAREAAMVAEESKGLGLRHSTLMWEGWDGSGNLQDAARRARLDLIGRWRGRVRHVLFAHTQDDQAETFLLRLRRGSGVEGLGAIRPMREVQNQGPLKPLKVPEGPPWPSAIHSGWYIVRPLLDVTRAELRHYLKVLRIPYVDDPTNEDPAYDRVRMRGLLAGLESEGLGRATLSATAGRMRRAAEALARRAHDAARTLSSIDHGDVLINRDAFTEVEADTQLRILAAALQFVASAEYRPRLASLEAALDRVLGGGAATLSGCQIRPDEAELRIFREYAAVAGEVVPLGEDVTCWDQRWNIDAEDSAGVEIRALGEQGLAQAGGHYPQAVRAALLAAPALFRGEALVACRRIGFGPEYTETLEPPLGHFPARLLAH